MRKLVLALALVSLCASASAQQAGSSNGFSSIHPLRVNATERGGAVTAGGAWQQVAPQNLLRQRFFLQNYCSAATQGVATAESIFLKIATATPTVNPVTGGGATELAACNSYDTGSQVLGTAPVWVWAATVSHRFQALEW